MPSESQLFESNESPGGDGLMAEFYKALWNSVSNLMMESLNYSYDYEELWNSEKRAILTLIEKKHKERRDIANWRPISFINIDVRIWLLIIKLLLKDWRVFCLVLSITINDVNMSKIELSVMP